jgi:hypothetical protein
MNPKENEKPPTPVHAHKPPEKRKEKGRMTVSRIVCGP